MFPCFALSFFTKLCRQFSAPCFQPSHCASFFRAHKQYSSDSGRLCPGGSWSTIFIYILLLRPSKNLQSAQKIFSTMERPGPRKISTLDAPVSSPVILRSSTRPNPNTSQQVCYGSSSTVYQTAAVTLSSDESRPPASYFHPMDPMSTKENVVANIKHGLLSTTGPGLPQCRRSLKDDHGRTRLETWQKQGHKGPEKDLDVIRQKIVHGNPTKRKDMTYQNDGNNESSLEHNAETIRNSKKCSVFTASGCHLQRHTNQSLQHSSSDSDDDGELQLLLYWPQFRKKQNQAKKSQQKRRNC